MVTELVNKHILGKPGIRRGGRLKVENTAAAILLLVHQYFDELIGRRRRRISERSIVVGQQVSF